MVRPGADLPGPPVRLVYGQASGLLRFSLPGAALLYWAGAGRLTCWPGLGKYGPVLGLPGKYTLALHTPGQLFPAPGGLALDTGWRGPAFSLAPASLLLAPLWLGLLCP